jgi:hypothetical protein
MQSVRNWLDVALILTLATAAGWGAQDKMVVVRPQDTGQPLANPGMGWVLHHYDNIAFNYGGKLEPSDTVDDFPGVTTVYLRIAWSHLEPEVGRFVWSVLDTPAQRWLDKGKHIALRFSCSESFMRYATPQWVEKAGAKGFNFTVGKGVDPNGPFWEPDYDDPIFLEKLDHFLAALADRYDGNPEVAFIDVGSFGVWAKVTPTPARENRTPSRRSSGTSTCTPSTSKGRCWWPTTISPYTIEAERPSSTPPHTAWACATTASSSRAATRPISTRISPPSSGGRPL